MSSAKNSQDFSDDSLGSAPIVPFSREGLSTRMIEALKSFGKKSDMPALERPAMITPAPEAQGSLLVPPPLVCTNAPKATPVPEPFSSEEFPPAGSSMPRPVKVPRRRMFAPKPIAPAPAYVTPAWLAPAPVAPVLQVPPKIVVTKTKDPLACPTCNKVFTAKRSLTRHLKIHSGEKSHVCQLCNKPFDRKTNLDRHVASLHQNQKDFTCGQCAKTFTRAENLTTHISHEACSKKRKAPATPATPSTKKPRKQKPAALGKVI